MTFAFGSVFQRMQPLVFLGDDVFVQTREDSHSAMLVTAAGVSHALGRLCSYRVLAQHQLRLNDSHVRQLLLQELSKRRAPSCSDTLTYFVEHLVPAFTDRDWDEDYRTDATPECRVQLPDFSIAAEQVIASAPLPGIPLPSLWLLGRAWVLRQMALAKNTMFVTWQGITFGLTGGYMCISALEKGYGLKVTKFVTRAANEITQSLGGIQESMAMQRAREELPRTGFIERGDLLFLPGSPSRLGYILPRHNNRVLGRQSDRDLAVTAPLELPPKLSTPVVYHRTSAGQWEPLHLPNGLCLGSGGPVVAPETPGLALAAHLRWAANRIASNRRFHANDN